MTKALKLMGLLTVAGLIAGNSFGLVLSDLGSNITIFDGDPASALETWGTGAPYGPGQEDNEVDYGASLGQAWDLEGFFYHADTMTLTGVGGFDFEDGYNGYFAGDVFIDVTGDAQIPATDAPSSLWGYDFVLDFGWNDASGNLSYDIIDLRSGPPVVLGGTWTSREGSNPYVYESGGISLGSGLLTDGTTYFSGLDDNLDGIGSDDVVGGDGTHNAFQVNMDWLINGALLDNESFESFTVHQTLNCGNDGHNGHVPDGGATLALLGMALVGLGAIAKKRR